jgi:hypothetical protein
MVVPILGKSGTLAPPDPILGALVAIFTSLGTGLLLAPVHATNGISSAGASTSGMGSGGDGKGSNGSGSRSSAGGVLDAANDLLTMVGGGVRVVIRALLVLNAITLLSALWLPSYSIERPKRIWVQVGFDSNLHSHSHSHLSSLSFSSSSLPNEMGCVARRTEPCPINGFDTTH